MTMNTVCVWCNTPFGTPAHMYTVHCDECICGSCGSLKVQCGGCDGSEYSDSDTENSEEYVSLNLSDSSDHSPQN